VNPFLPTRTFIPSSTWRDGLACCLLFAAATAAHAENWPGWRGPARSGLTTETGVPTTWSPTEAVLWKTPLPGTGLSNPIVWGDRVFVTAAEGREQGELHVFCFDRDTGKARWHKRLWGTAPTVFYYPKSGLAGPTPITDGKRLWAFFGTGDLFCFDLDGGLVWQRSLADEYGPFENRFAATSSPLLFRAPEARRTESRDTGFSNTVILQCDHYGASYVLAVDADTGANRWKSDRPEAWLSWSSPQLVAVGDRSELLISGSEKLDGYDPIDGRRLWTVRGLQRECVPTPIAGAGIVFVESGPNGDHFAVKPGGSGDVTDTHVVWRNNRGTSFVPSPIVYGPRYYLADDRGILSCLSTTDGELLWRKRLSGKFTASPVATDGKLFFTNEEGTTFVLNAESTEYEELSQNELGEDVYASPAVSQGRLFFRTTKHLICLGTK
jgi:outer membrane protein assembly factor BamB